MTEKRFRLTNPKNKFRDMNCGINDKNKILTFTEVVDTLNELHERNELLKLQVETKLFSRRQLEKENEQLKSSDTITDLETEIAKLKTEIDTYKAGNKTIHARLKTLHEENQDLKTGTYINAKNTIKELKEENTHIKTTIQTMIKNERTRIGQSVLQQLWEAIQ